MKRVANLFSASIFSILALSSVSRAETEGVVIAKKPTNQVYEDSSEANRIGKKGTILLNMIGFGPGGAPGTGLGGGLYLDRNKLILVELRGGKGPYYRSYSSSGYSSGSWYEYSGKSESVINQIGVHYKQFTGNSFYFRLGADYSKVKYNFEYDTGNVLGYDYTSKFEGESLQANFTIGNQWQWENFTLGCDWIGFASPLYSKVLSESISGNPTKGDRQAFEDDKQRLISENSAIALRLYIGASF